MLIGREAECVAIERLLRSAVEGRSGSLVVRGEAGIGKTALLEHAQRQAGVTSRTQLARVLLDHAQRDAARPS
jgi:predicted ATPase